jgi:hypothetical protein
MAQTTWLKKESRQQPAERETSNANLLAVPSCYESQTTYTIDHKMWLNNRISTTQFAYKTQNKTETGHNT